MTHIMELYFEAHITVKPPQSAVNQEVEAELWEYFVKSAEEQGWKASKFDVDEVDHYDGAWFLSARSDSYEHLFRDMRYQKELLETAKYEFIRGKIENTLFDTKHGGVL